MRKIQNIAGIALVLVSLVMATGCTKSTDDLKSMDEYRQLNDQYKVYMQSVENIFHDAYPEITGSGSQKWPDNYPCKTDGFAPQGDRESPSYEQNFIIAKKLYSFVIAENLNTAFSRSPAWTNTSPNPRSIDTSGVVGIDSAPVGQDRHTVGLTIDIRPAIPYDVGNDQPLVGDPLLKVTIGTNECFHYSPRPGESG